MRLILKAGIILMTLISVSIPLHAAPGLSTGQQAPDFEAIAHNGEKVRLSELYAEGPVVLIFYRGAWCPYCNTHLQKFQRSYEAFSALGVTLLGLSVDKPEFLSETVSENSLSFDIVSDTDLSILKDYNLVFEVPEPLRHKYKTEYGIDLEKHSGRDDGVIAVPATYVINTSGQIVFAYANEDYKVRTDPREVLSFLTSD